MKQVIMTLAALGLAVLMAWASLGPLLWYFDLPTVYKSNATGECVYVELSGGTEGSCSNLPNRYTPIWVE